MHVSNIHVDDREVSALVPEDLTRRVAIIASMLNCSGGRHMDEFNAMLPFVSNCRKGPVTPKGIFTVSPPFRRFIADIQLWSLGNLL